MGKQIGPSFIDELTAYGGLVGQHFTWQPDGTIEFFDDTPPAVVRGVQAVYAAHDPTKTPLRAQAATLLAAGLGIVSTGTPSLNGIYACDPLAQADIVAIETSLNAGKGFPGGGTTMNYPDASGAMHSFTEGNFASFASAVRDYVYALRAVMAGTSTTLPQSPATIS
jgi:hypothetical protein